MWRRKLKPFVRKPEDVMYLDTTLGSRCQGMLSELDAGVLGRAEAEAALVRALVHLLVKAA